MQRLARAHRITAVVLGGTPLTGGIGNMTNTVVGAFIISILLNGMVILACRPRCSSSSRGSCWSARSTCHSSESRSGSSSSPMSGPFRRSVPPCHRRACSSRHGVASGDQRPAETALNASSSSVTWILIILSIACIARPAAARSGLAAARSAGVGRPTRRPYRSLSQPQTLAPRRRWRSAHPNSDRPRPGRRSRSRARSTR